MNKIKISFFDMVLSVSNVIDMISPILNGHHKYTAYIAADIAKDIGLPISDQSDIFLAGLLHDCGALSLKEKLDALNFEIEYPHEHAERGYRFLKKCKYMKNVADIVRYHHVDWCDIKNYSCKESKIPVGSHILNLADRVDVLINKQKGIAEQVGWICARVNKEAGKKFNPELVKSFLRLSSDESFWSGVHQPLAQYFRKQKLRDVALDFREILDITKLFERVIDFRSRFTAAHSSGVAAAAEALGNYMGLPEDRCRMLRIAGYLHDIGKLAVPIEYIEKPGKLTKQEFETVKKHAIHTYNALKNVKGFEKINEFAAFHHERLNGTGYPFGLKEDEMVIESRVVCVADIFTAITEDRPYRTGMDSKSSLKVLKSMADNKDIDKGVVSVLETNFEQINSIRIQAQVFSKKEYEEFFE